ncbi:hypothetical protein [Heliophilum fasciatum]|uniref:Calcineurin-like phosphoesterase family protein n=1 Tax=Heliophilum fasciatum TaxID=35700 RepID=A0A4R2RC19_9FIRM|nr:hypothetical protein [Heliophilum fasciatum]MCW2279471.1 diadenosine tetraphosphatase ApaH/serine/threonine PP2A family protein phosphatase [Heliophilum fasciatum]TCP59778.1 hypothetical protein EDD73_1492 [Heliophilum fasciatum]
MARQQERDLLWLREEFYLSPLPTEKKVIFGHTPTDMITGTWYPFITDQRVGIDTGCVFGGCLSAVELDEGRVTAVYQVGHQASRVG